MGSNPQNLTERRFRDYWTRSDKSETERIRFREVGRPSLQRFRPRLGGPLRCHAMRRWNRRGGAARGLESSVQDHGPSAARQGRRSLTSLTNLAATHPRPGSRGRSRSRLRSRACRAPNVITGGSAQGVVPCLVRREPQWGEGSVGRRQCPTPGTRSMDAARLVGSAGDSVSASRSRAVAMAMSSASVSSSMLAWACCYLALFR